MPTSPPPGAPPHPTPATQRHEFGATLRALRTWAGLTQKTLEDREHELSDSAISEHERGARWPRWEWVHTFVTACLRHRMPDASPAALNAELEPWRTEWGRLNTPHTQQATNPVQPAPAPQATQAATDTPDPQTPQEPPLQAVSAAQEPESPVAARTDEPAVSKRPHRWRLWTALAGVAAVAALVVIAINVMGAPGGGKSQTPAPSITAAPPSRFATPGETYTETVNTAAGARTYTNPHGLVGEGPRISNGRAVQVSCRITVPSAAPSVGVHWYLIADPPWNNSYFAPANTFLNGDPPAGPHVTEVDQAIPLCPR
jgi:hypothetical protein